MTLYIHFFLLILFQVVGGEITVTLQDTEKNPMIGETIQFITESEQLVLANCVTNANGNCTMAITDKGDASGFIRGYLNLNGRGQRPVIWPGGLLSVTLTLDNAGQLSIPSDAYVTRTPKATPPDTPTHSPTHSPPDTPPDTPPPDTPTDEATPEIAPTEQATPEIAPTEQATPEIAPTDETSAGLVPLEAQVFRVFLILTLLCTLIIYIWKTKQ